MLQQFNERLKMTRKASNKTQKETAVAIGLGERNYQSFEYGKIKPSFDTLVALAIYFNVSVDYLVGLSENPQANK